MSKIPLKWALNRQPGEVLYPELYERGQQFCIDFDMAGVTVPHQTRGDVLLVQRVPISRNRKEFLQRLRELTPAKKRLN